MRKLFLVCFLLFYPLLYWAAKTYLIAPISEVEEKTYLSLGSHNVTEVINSNCECEEEEEEVEGRSPLPTIPRMYDYSMIQKAVLKRLDRTSKVKFKAIVFKENGDYGIGNLYRSMASVFMLAIVTNRTFYVDFSYYNVFFRPKFPAVRMVDDQVYKKEYSQLWYDAQIGDYYLDKDFCGQNLNQYWKEDVIVFNTITDMSHLILDNPAHMRVLRRLGIVKSSDYDSQHQEILQYGYLNLFSNSKGFMDTLDAWRPQFKEHRIGVQFRTGGSVANTFETTRYLVEQDVEQAITSIQEYCAKNRISQDSLTIHLSTDSDRVVQMFRKVYGQHLFVPPQHSIIHTSFAKAQTKFDGYVTALTDIALLRECEYLLLTWQSSFGWCAGMQMEKWKGAFLVRDEVRAKKAPRLINPW